MKATRCESCKQFYDLEKFNECPYCHTPAHNISNQSFEDKAPTFDMQKTNESLQEAPASQPKNEEKQHKHIWGKKNRDAEETVENIFGTPEVPAEPQTQPVFNNAPIFEEQKQAQPVLDSPIQQKMPDFTSQDQAGSLAQAVSQSQPDDMKTVAFYNFSNNADPVVGWLICVKGEYIGESFNVVSGRNNIGRALTNSIALTKEKTVSREKHAAIIFDPKNKQFFIQPGESSGLTYLNDELILGVKPLKHKDFINMGATRFMFFQLCDDKFSWDIYIN